MSGSVLSIRCSFLRWKQSCPGNYYEVHEIVLLFLSFLNFSPQPRWRPSVGNCTSHRAANSQRCTAAPCRGTLLLALHLPRSSPDCTHTLHTLPRRQGSLKVTEIETQMRLKKGQGREYIAGLRAETHLHEDETGKC